MFDHITSQIFQPHLSNPAVSDVGQHARDRGTKTILHSSQTNIVPKMHAAKSGNDSWLTKLMRGMGFSQSGRSRRAVSNNRTLSQVASQYTPSVQHAFFAGPLGNGPVSHPRINPPGTERRATYPQVMPVSHFVENRATSSQPTRYLPISRRNGTYPGATRGRYVELWSSNLRENFKFSPGSIDPHGDLTMPHLKKMFQNAMSAMELERKRDIGIDVTPLQHQISQCRRIIINKRNQIISDCNEWKSRIDNSDWDQTSLQAHLRSLDENLERLDSLFSDILSAPINEQAKYLQKNFQFPERLENRKGLQRLRDMLQHAIGVMEDERKNGIDVTPLQNQVDRCCGILISKRNQIIASRDACGPLIHNPLSDQTSLQAHLRSFDKNLERLDSLFSEILNAPVNEQIGCLQNNLQSFPDRVHPEDGITMPRLRDMLQHAIDVMENERNKGIDVTPLWAEIDRCRLLLIARRNQIISERNVWGAHIGNPAWEQTSVHAYLRSLDENLNRFDSIFSEIVKTPVNEQAEYLRNNFQSFPDSVHPEDEITMPRLRDMLERAIDVMESERNKGGDVIPLRKQINWCRLLLRTKRDQIISERDVWRSQVDNPAYNRTSVYAHLRSLDENLNRFDSVFSGILYAPGNEQAEYLKNHFQFFPDSIHPEDGKAMPGLREMLQHAIGVMENDRSIGIDVTPLRDQINSCLQILVRKENQIISDRKAWGSKIDDPDWNQTLVQEKLRLLDESLDRFDSLFLDILSNSGTRGRENSLMDLFQSAGGSLDLVAEAVHDQMRSSTDADAPSTEAGPPSLLFSSFVPNELR